MQWFHRQYTVEETIARMADDIFEFQGEQYRPVQEFQYVQRRIVTDALDSHNMWIRKFLKCIGALH